MFYSSNQTYRNMQKLKVAVFHNLIEIPEALTGSRKYPTPRASPAELSIQYAFYFRNVTAAIS